MFKRRDKLPTGARLRALVWPRSGWKRALQYLRLRVNRIPDSPSRIGRGIAAGVASSFTPLFGLHLPLAMAIAWVIRGNVIASLLGCLISNPLTFPFIAFASLECGRRILGHGHNPNTDSDSLVGMFGHAMSQLGHNLIAPFTGATVHWGHLHAFFEGVFLPYLVGGTVPGLICGLVSYGLTRWLVAAYQARRRVKLRARLEAARARLDTREQH